MIGRSKKATLSVVLVLAGILVLSTILIVMAVRGYGVEDLVVSSEGDAIGIAREALIETLARTN